MVLLSLPIQSEETVIDVAGKWWIVETGMEIEVTQNGNQITWWVPAFNQKGIGTIEGREFKASWEEAAGAQALEGEIVQVSPDGRALAIALSNGLTLSCFPPLFYNLIQAADFCVSNVKPPLFSLL